MRPLSILVALLLSQAARADLVVRDVHSTGTIGTLAAADALIGGTGILSETTEIAPFVNYFDADGGGGPGNFGGSVDFPNASPGIDDDDFATIVTGRVNIVTAGDWTFGVNSDDGSRLIISGSTLISDDTTHAPEDRFGTINLATGWHDLNLLFFERGGGATVELFAAPGVHTSFVGNGFQLVGDTANGGLQTSTAPEPGIFGLLYVIATLSLGLRRRRPTNFAPAMPGNA